VAEEIGHQQLEMRLDGSVTRDKPAPCRRLPQPLQLGRDANAADDDLRHILRNRELGEVRDGGLQANPD
jgi:hypothetical protein